MKHLILIFAFLFTALFSFGQNSSITITITVTIYNAVNDNGKILLSLHNRDTFMKADALQGLSSNIKNGKVVAKFKNVELGTYAIIVLHDENDNKQMDFMPNGMPKENYGMSNNPISFGPPRFEEAEFEVTDQDINMNIRF